MFGCVHVPEQSGISGWGGWLAGLLDRDYCGNLEAISFLVNSTACSVGHLQFPSPVHNGSICAGQCDEQLLNTINLMVQIQCSEHTRNQYHKILCTGVSNDVFIMYGRPVQTLPLCTRGRPVEMTNRAPCRNDRIRNDLLVLPCSRIVAS